MQDIVLRNQVIRYRRERWLTPEGRLLLAPLPSGIDGRVGPELCCFALLKHHYGQVTVERLTTQFKAIDVSISKRQGMRLPIGGQEPFLAENQDVLRTGLQTAAWITVDDSGARHGGRNRYCTHIGEDDFALSATRSGKSRLNFLDLLRAGHHDYVIDDAALADMRSRSLAGSVISLLKAQPQAWFADPLARQAHLDHLGISTLTVTPDPAHIATEAAIWGSIHAHGFLADTFIVSDDAGQFAIRQHALCWVRAERLVHKLDTFTDLHRAAQERIRTLIQWFYADLKAHCAEPTMRRRFELHASFDRIFRRRTTVATLDRLIERLHANKSERLKALERREIPLHTNGSERDIRLHVTKRKIIGDTSSDAGRDCRDAFLGLMRTTTKLGISLWDYFGNRLAISSHQHIPHLPNIVPAQGHPA